MYSTSTPMPTHQLSDSNRGIMGNHNDNNARNLRVYQTWKGSNVILSFQLVSLSLKFPFLFSSLCVSLRVCYYQVLCCPLLFLFLALTQLPFLASFKLIFTFLPTESVKIIGPQGFFFFFPFHIVVFTPHPANLVLLQPDESLCNLNPILVFKC